MRITFKWGLILALVALFLPLQTSAQGVQAVITSPSMNAVVRGKVLIQGSASHPNFWKYEIHIAPEPNPSGQGSVIGIHESPVISGLLETWDTATVPDGSYSILLRVVDKTGNYQEYSVRQISVANAAPTETPTPTATRPPTNTPVPRDTPTVIVIEAATDISAATPTATLARPTPAPAVSVSGFDIGGWGQAFAMGAGAMLALFVLFGLLQIIKKIL